MVTMSNGTPNISARLIVLCIITSASLLGLLSANATPGEKPSAEQIFRTRCASCHGAKGEGTKQYNKALAGSKSIAELGGFIAKSMPPGAARKLAPEQAKSVASFIYDAFYSPIAQERNRPVRVELSHLTVRQYCNAIADLIG